MTNTLPRRRRAEPTRRSGVPSTRRPLRRRIWSARLARRTEEGRSADHVRSIRERIRRRLRHCRRHSCLRLLRSTKRSIGQPTTDRALDRLLGAFLIAYAERDPLVVAKIELCQITLQMFFADVVIYAVDAALEDREIAFNRVRMCVAPDILFDRV